MFEDDDKLISKIEDLDFFSPAHSGVEGDPTIATDFDDFEASDDSAILNILRDQGETEDEDATIVISAPELPEALLHNSEDVQDQTTTPQPTKKFGRYNLIKRIGLGGMAEVFLANQDGPAGFRKRVVIKRILPHLTLDERFVKMFLQEARIAASLTHSNIVQIYELGEENGHYFLAMEYIDGASIHQIARICWYYNRPVPIELIISAAADAALGLHYAHNFQDPDGRPAGLIHRDISPDNLMVNKEGVTKILDFGIAKTRSRGNTRNTHSGELKGKLPYMAPEVIRSLPLDGRTDLYALGVCMYWLLTGQRPHSGASDSDVFDSILKHTPRPPKSLNRQIPSDLNDLVMSLLAKKPRDRPANGEILHDILAAMLPNRNRVVADFVAQTMGWARELAEGVKPGERPNTFVAAASCLSNSAPRSPVIPLVQPPPHGSLFSAERTEDLFSGSLNRPSQVSDALLDAPTRLLPDLSDHILRGSPQSTKKIASDIAATLEDLGLPSNITPGRGLADELAAPQPKHRSAAPVVDKITGELIPGPLEALQALESLEAIEDVSHDKVQDGYTTDVLVKKSRRLTKLIWLVFALLLMAFILFVVFIRYFPTENSSLAPKPKTPLHQLLDEAPKPQSPVTSKRQMAK